MNFKEAQRWKI